MTESFYEAKTTRERLDIHSKVLNFNGYDLDDNTGGKWKLHDLHSRRYNSWVECKTDYSGFDERILVEAYANVPAETVKQLPYQKPIPHHDLLAFLSDLPTNNRALATDDENVEPRHLLTYFHSRTMDFRIYDVHEVRRQFAASHYDWIVCGDSRDPWRSICAIMPLADCAPILELSQKDYIDAIRNS